MKRVMMAALAVGGVFTALAVAPAAEAAPLAKASQQIAPQGIVNQVARGFGRGGGGGRGIGGGGRFMGRGIGGGRGIGRGIGRGPGHAFRGGIGGGPRHAYNGPRGGHHHHRGSRLRGLYYAAPFVGYGAYYYGSGDGYSCAWLRRRAEATGSSYWWQRYEECLDDY